MQRLVLNSLHRKSGVAKTKRAKKKKANKRKKGKT